MKIFKLLKDTLNSGGPEERKKKKRKGTRKSTKVNLRRKVWTLNKGNVIFQKFNRQQTQMIMDNTIFFSDDETDIENEADEKRTKVNILPIRKLPRFNPVNELFELLDSFDEKLQKQRTNRVEKSFNNENSITEEAVPAKYRNLMILNA